jgi:thiol-disulfide isomerase/thioredoxin
VREIVVDREAVMGKVIGKCLLALSFLGAVAAAGTARAGEQPFDAARFAQDNAAGRSAIVYFHATWCPVCKIQQPIVQRLSARPEMRGVTIYIADYDKEVVLKQQMKITQQSTFVIFKGGREVTRATGQTRARDIENTFDKAL